MFTEKTLTKYKQYVGKTFGNILVQDIDLTTPNRIYFICKCLNCNRQLRIRNDALTSNRIGCTKCLGAWRRQNFNEKNKNLPPKDIRYKYIHFKCNAENRGIKFLLTKEQAMTICEQDCFYCGKKRCLGIDRLDNSKDYTIENCVPCCGCCNRMKMDLTPTFFFQQINKIYNKHKESSTTIPEGSTSKVIVDGKGERLVRDEDIVLSAQ